MYRGPYFAVMELQARWATMVFAEKITLPSEETLKSGLLDEQKIRKQTPRPQFPHGDYVGLADSIAEEIHVLPDLEYLKENNNSLYNMVNNGPYSTCHYRLFGENNRKEIAYKQIKKITKAAQTPEYNEKIILSLQKKIEELLIEL
ncbi:MAG: hypothetical protein LEGION0398_MBIBDBAK_01450 [Legionellaceae bacterium]